MSKSNKNRGKAWTSAEVKKLRELAKKHISTADIGVRLGRTKSGVRHKALHTLHSHIRARAFSMSLESSGLASPAAAWRASFAWG